MAKIRSIYKVFTDAYRSEVSCIILDDIESLMEYVPLGTRFNMFLVQTLQTLLKQLPPRGKKLMIIATSSNPAFLRELGVHQHFTHTMSVPVVQEPAQALDILESLGVFTREEQETLREKLEGVGLRVGIKKLIDISMTARQASDNKIDTFVHLISRAGGIV